MTQAALTQELETLDSGFFPEVYDFIEFLKTRYGKARRQAQADKQTVASQIEAFYNAQTADDASFSKRAEEMSTATVWETLKNDTW
ncbi:MAG: hypothetical protein LBM77_04780 [Spirochaetaceae bacterium]|jgi:hypothetical protein|nr:hypothetical protein [Spirochaetaceae bacterium]